MNFEFEIGCIHEFKDNNEKSCSWCRKRVSHKIDLDSHAGGWSMWRPLALISIFWETVSLIRLHIFCYYAQCYFYTWFIYNKYYSKENLKKICQKISKKRNSVRKRIFKTKIQNKFLVRHIKISLFLRKWQIKTKWSLLGPSASVKNIWAC